MPAILRQTFPSRATASWKTSASRASATRMNFSPLRGSFQKKLFGWDGTLTEEQTNEIAASKRVIYDAFKDAVQAAVPKEKAGILVDEQFGADIRSHDNDCVPEIDFAA